VQITVIELTPGPKYTSTDSTSPPEGRQWCANLSTGMSSRGEIECQEELVVATRHRGRGRGAPVNGLERVEVLDESLQDGKETLWCQLVIDAKRAPINGNGAEVADTEN
jgi:hypothetical protein